MSIASRFFVVSMSNLKSNPIRYDVLTGGESDSETLGINWYLIDRVRLTANWVHWHTNNGSGTYTGSDRGDSAVGRVQVSF